MFFERTSAGLDVHARSVVAHAVDWQTGEAFKARLVPVDDEVVGWVRALPGPVAVTYEAGPTGFGLARAFTAAGIRCVVVAPSKVERPPGDRVKTDRRDAIRLARLLHIGELPQVRVPTEFSSGARRVQGSITKAGNTHARRLLVEAAKHHQRPGQTLSAGPDEAFALRMKSPNTGQRLFVAGPPSR